MSIYPKQLQKFDEASIAQGPGGSKVREGAFGEEVILANGSPVVTDYTVNMIIRFLEEAYTNYITTIDHTKHEARFRPFDTAFGDVVVFDSPDPIVGDQTANELIEVLRTLYDINRARTATKTGYATSVLN